MKGISTIVAIVLLLMVTVGLVAVAYMWLSNMFSMVSSQSGRTVEERIKSLGTSISIESAEYNPTSDAVELVLRNTGRENIDLSTMAAYIDDIFQDIQSGNQGTLPPGGIKPGILVKNTTESCGKTIKITVYPQASALYIIRC
ncbi:MAG: hypothetical protein GXO63_03090 [Candidatus Micrarchaeota archaeon]|nr:hypothetical protein [Candidatus Micrarchaeota archaeon]